MTWRWHGVRPTAMLAAVPSLGQHLLMMDLIKGEGIDPTYIAISWGATLVLAVLLGFLSYQFYRRENIVG